MNIHDLVELTGESPRQIRYLVAEGLMPPPDGGRATASYGEPHWAAIRAYQRLRALGFRPAAIRLLRQGSGGPVTVAIAPGLSLSIDPSLLAGTADAPPPDPQALAARIATLLADILTETAHHDPAARSELPPADGD